MKERTKSVKERQGYLSNKEFVAEVVKCQEEGQISDRLARMFMLLAEKTSTHRFFVRYPYREDLISEGILACVKAYKKFDVNRQTESGEPNAHAFYTSCIFNAFKMYTKNQYNQKNIKDALLVENNMDPSYGYKETMDDY